MNHHCLFSVVGLTALVSLAQGQVASHPAEKDKVVKQTWTAPRAQDGHPDLQGVWSNNNATPMERPSELAGRVSLTDDEVAALRSQSRL